MSKSTQRLRADVTGVIMVFGSMAIGQYRIVELRQLLLGAMPMTRNSVLLRLRESKLADIQDKTWVITDWR